MFIHLSTVVILLYLGSPTYGEPGSTWHISVVPYVFDSDFTSSGRTLFLEAAKKIEDKTCIRFREKEWNDSHWLKVTHGNKNNTVECGSSAIGRQVNSKNGQDLTINQRCLNSSNFEHKLGFALGFPREQNRPDRDDYIVWDDDIACSQEGPTPKVDHMNQAAFEIFYDYVSIMHDNNECMYAQKSGPITFGGSGGPNSKHPVNTFSVLDYEKLNAMYDCDGCKSYRFQDRLKVNYYSGKIVAGIDTNNETLYVCRTYHKGGILIGKATLDTYDEDTGRLFSFCRIAMNNKEFIYKDFEVLTNPRNVNLTWVKRPQDFSIPPTAIVGGRTVDRDPIYIARCSFNLGTCSTTTPGSLYAGAKELKVPYSNMEVTCTDYEILVCS